jgi:hypothetical protein
MLTLIILSLTLCLITIVDSIISYRCFKSNIHIPILSFLSATFLTKGLAAYTSYRFIILYILFLVLMVCHLYPHFISPRFYLVIVDLVSFTIAIVKGILYYLHSEPIH